MRAWAFLQTRFSVFSTSIPPAFARDALPPWRSARALLGGFAAFAGPRGLALAALLILLGTAFEGVGILLIVPAIPLLLERGNLVDKMKLGAADWLPGTIGPGTGMALLLVGFTGLMAARAAVIIARDTHIAHLQHGYVQSTKNALFEKLAAADWHEIMQLEHARLGKALGGDMVQLSAAVHCALQAAIGCLALLAYASFALALAPQLALITFALLAVGALAATAWIPRLTHVGAALIGHEHLMASSASRFFAGLKLAIAQNLQSEFVTSYTRASREALRNRVAFTRQTSTSRQLAALLWAVTAVTAVVGSSLVSAAAPVTLIAFIVLLARMMGPAAAVQQGVQQVAYCLPLYDELRSLTSSLPERRFAPASVHETAMPPRGVEIRLSSVSFEHCGCQAETRGGLEDISLRIAPGSLVGISGPCGSGKTTLLDLLAGLIEPKSGQLLVNGAELPAERLAEYRRGLAFLGADPAVLGDTVRANLRWCAPWSTEDGMWAALRIAEADNLVRRLGDGLDSRLDECGANLSAGERQQLALARALLRLPALLLLDEATCSLDAACERRLLANLASLDPRPTILLISHRAETLALCEKVVSLANGRIAGDGERSRQRSTASAASLREQKHYSQVGGLV